MISHSPAGTVQVSWRRPRFWLLVVSNPLWIALTAPARWLLDRASGFGHRGWRGPPAAGVREPRRPKPGLPDGSVALAEPRTVPVTADRRAPSSPASAASPLRPRDCQLVTARRAGPWSWCGGV